MKNRLIKNASSSVVQFMVNSVVLFVFYKFLLSTIGAKDIGIWSLVLGISSLSQIAAFGFSGGAVKYVAQYLARQQEDKVAEVIQTSLLSVGFLVGIFIMLGYPLFKMFIVNAVGVENTFKVEQILPLGIVCLWLMMLVNVIFSSLDGYQKMYLRNYINMGSSVVNLLLCFIVVPRFQLLGLAYLSLLQNIILVTFGWILLKRLNVSLPLIPMSWDRKIFREVIGYNVKFQLISFTSMLCEPTTKYFLGVFGGAASVGYYDMASRLAGQARGVLVSANQALVPTIANYQEQDSGKVRGIYINSFQLLLFIILPIYCVLLLAAPLISQVWVGSKNELFIFALCSLFVAHMFNILSNPAYFANIGTGHLNRNLFAHVGIAISNLALSYFMGMQWGATGVILAWSSSLLMGSVYIFVSYNLKNMILIGDVFTKHFVRLVLFVAFVFSVGQLSFWKLKEYNILTISAFVIGFVMIGLTFFQWRHPFYIKIYGWFVKKGLSA